MKNIINKLMDKGVNNGFIIVIIFFFILSTSFYLFFQEYKANLIEKASSVQKTKVEYFNAKLNNIFLKHNKEELTKEINNLLDTKFFKEISIDKKRYLFDKNSLIENSLGFNDKSWKIAEVVVDARYGFVKRLSNSSLYEFVSSNSFDPSQPINIRYQVYKKGQIRNIITKLDFSNINIKKNIPDTSKFITNFVNFNEEDINVELKKDDILALNVKYKLNNTLVKDDLQSFLNTIILLYLVIFLPIIFFFGFYHKVIFKKYVTTPATNLNKYIDNILNDRFSVINKKEFEGTPELKELTRKVSKVSSKIASLRNELNINKESLELKVSTDGLTGLPNKTIFDFDIKTMFVSLTKGYVFIIRVDQLSTLSKKHDSGYINSFVETYVNIIKNIIFKYSKTDLKLYRFFGSQFAIIARNMEMENANKMCQEIIDELYDNMSIIYDIPDDLVQIGGTVFDLYGSLDSVIASTNTAYETSKKKGPNSYHILGMKDIEKNYTLLDNTVIDIINKEDFNMNFILDSYLFDEPEKIIMTEATPSIYDLQNNKLPIGSFIAVAQKLGIADKFDKLVITKVMNHIKENEISHEIAINLTISSIENINFIKWLEEIMAENEDIVDKLVFSFTSYTAYLNRQVFTNFVSKVHNMGMKVILKRYKTDEFPLDKLEDLNLDYIRMNQEYTINFTNDLVKKHKVKNILIFAELNNINVIADSVKLDSDYDFLERLGTYATSR